MLQIFCFVFVDTVYVATTGHCISENAMDYVQWRI